MRAALYARYSSDEQNPRSADDQLAACRRLAAKLDATVVAEFKDEAITGTHDNRPGRHALMAAAAAGEFELLITEGLDRMARSGGGTWDAFEDLAALGIPIHTLEQGEIDVFKTGVYALQSAGFIDQLRKKVRRGLRAATESGRHNAQPPFGYRARIAHDARGERIRGLIEVHPDQAKVVQRIAAEFLAGSTVHAIRDRLNNDGVPGPKGRPWSYAIINGRHADRTGILRNPIYAGELVWGRVRETKNRRTGKVTRRLTPDEEIVRQPAPELAILDAATWAEIQARVASRRAEVLAAGNPGVANAPQRLLTGLMRCGVCGGAMHTSGGERRWRCVTRMNKGAVGCSNARTVPPDIVEAQVLDNVRRDLLHPEAIETFVREFHAAQRQSSKGRNAERAGLEKEISEARRRAERLVDQVAEGILSGATVAGKLADFEVRIATLQSRLDAIERTADIVPIDPQKTATLYRTMADDLRATLDRPAGGPGSLELETSRAALRKIVRAVVIHPLPERGQYRVELQGDLTSVFSAATQAGAGRRKASR